MGIVSIILGAISLILAVWSMVQANKSSKQSDEMLKPFKESFHKAKTIFWMFPLFSPGIKLLKITCMTETTKRSTDKIFWIFARMNSLPINKA